MRSVVTLHDVTFMHTPTFGRVTTWGMTQVVRRAAHDADSLIAVSHAARHEICATLDLDPKIAKKSKLPAREIARINPLLVLPPLSTADIAWNWGAR